MKELMTNITTNIDIISILVSTVSLVLVLYILIKSMRKSRYDSTSKRAMIDDLRSYYENQIYQINNKMISSKERWDDVNHLLLRDEMLNKNNNFSMDSFVKMNNFLECNGINEKDLLVDRRMIFVLTPFNAQFEKDYLEIKQICDEVGFKCVRGDEQFFSSDIFSQVLKLIVQSRLVIANLNGRNANVLYELGIAQALDKPTILITKNPLNLPIDLKSKRFLVYDNYTELEWLLRSELIKILKD